MPKKTSPSQRRQRRRHRSTGAPARGKSGRGRGGPPGSERRASGAALAVGLAGVGDRLGAQRGETPDVLAKGARRAAVAARGASDGVLEFDVRVDAIRAAVALHLRHREASGAGQGTAADGAAGVLDGGLRDARVHLHEHLGLHVLVESHAELLVLADAQLLHLTVVLLLHGLEALMDLDGLPALLLDGSLDVRGNASVHLEGPRRGEDEGGRERATKGLHCDEGKRRTLLGRLTR
mmetsp:Transcript_73198/g.238051  ORF Transcript_73198/g.238051 Transcript_73198/m.238051 type:complete len:236 (+) Transcript_73198:15-722(+)